LEQSRVKGNHLIQTGLRPGFLIPIALAAFSFNVGAVHGQEALRISTAGDLAAAAQRQAESSIGYYNLLLGPVAWRFSSGLEVDYNDNVRLQEQNPESDVIFHPNFDAQMHWPVTQVNDLNLSVMAGYSAYAQHQDLDQLYINPGSGLTFNIYSGDFVINLHDQISITENSYQNQSAGGNNGNATYASLQNSAGVNALWDLNKALVMFGYDHANYLALNSGQGLPDAASENFFLNGGVRPAPEILAGLETGFGLIHYSGSGAAGSAAGSADSPDATQWNAGAFCTATISDYLDARLDAGYTVFTPDSTSTNYSSSSSSGFYLQLLITQRVNRFFNYTLSGGRSIDLQYTGQPYDRYTVRWQPNWNFLKKFTISTPLWWEHGTQIYYQTTSYDQYGAGIIIGRQLTQKLSCGLTYQFVKETSGQQGLNYTDNIVGLSFTYQF
jgi:hypothetical protein